MTCEPPRPVRRVAFRTLAEFEIADDPSRGCYFVFGVRKSGSSLLNMLLQALAWANGIHFVDIAGTLFGRGVHLDTWQHDEGLAAVLAPGNLYGGFRNFPFGLARSPIYKESRKVLMVRDPRDALVSEYFSDAYSHSLPAGGEEREVMLGRRQAALATPIDEHVVGMAPALRQTLEEYRQAAGDPHLLLLRYEDVIFDKRRLLLELCAFLGWAVTEEQIGEILSWADLRPEREEPARFVRKVTPGDHREKLSSRTIAKLDRILGREMEFYGYQPAAGPGSPLRGWLSALARPFSARHAR